MALLQLPKKGISPTKDGAVPAVKDAGFLLLLMADKGAVAAVKNSCCQRCWVPAATNGRQRRCCSC